MRVAVPQLILRCRRAVFERVLRGFATAEPGVTLVQGHVEFVHNPFLQCVQVLLVGVQQLH